MYLKLFSVLTKLIEGIITLLFFIMSGLVCLQVFYRYVLNSPLTGSEEAARALLIYVVMLGSAVAVADKSHMAVDYFYERFSRPIKYTALGLYFLSIFSVGMLLAIYGYELAGRTMMQATPALQIPKGMIVYAFPISGVLICSYSLMQVLQKIHTPKHQPAFKKQLAE